jgi:SHS2 domain-containing protein
VNDLAPSAAAKITLKVDGNSLPQLFENAAHALFKTLIDHETVGETLREKVVAEGEDSAALLQAWMNALIQLASHQFIIHKKSRFQVFDAERKGPGKLRAEITGELVDPQRHVFRIDPAQIRCERVELINDSKTLAAQIFLISEKIKLA